VKSDGNRETQKINSIVDRRVIGELPGHENGYGSTGPRTKGVIRPTTKKQERPNWEN